MNEQTRNVLLGAGAGAIVGIIFIAGVVSAGMAKLKKDGQWDGKIDWSVKRSYALDQKLDQEWEREHELSTFMASRSAAARQLPLGNRHLPPAEDPNKVYVFEVGPTPVLGKVDAPVAITMFADLECPYCARFYEPIKEVLNAYPGKARFMIKNFPLSFHRNAMPSAKVALAAGLQGKYFEMVDILMKNSGQASEDKLKEYAKTLGLDEKKLLESLKAKDAEFEKQIKADMSLGERSGVRGTPTFFLNGKKTRAHSLTSWKAEIDKILSSK
jgi:protein-disulfide isomerase